MLKDDNPPFTGWRRWMALVAILIALGVPSALAFKEWQSLKNSPVVKIAINGFDPRDMLRGHYMRFMFDWNWAPGQPNAQACDSVHCCLCLESGQGTDPAASIMACDEAEPPACPIRLEGYYNGDEIYDLGLDEYYVSETRAYELEQLLREDPGRFRMGLSLRPSGNVSLEKMYIDDMSVEEYLRQTPPHQD